METSNGAGAHREADVAGSVSNEEVLKLLERVEFDRAMLEALAHYVSRNREAIDKALGRH